MYEDHLNSIPVVNLVTSDLEDLTEFIVDDAHLANPVVTKEVDLPDAPSIRCKRANWELGLRNALHYSVSKGVIQRKERGLVKCNLQFK